MQRAGIGLGNFFFHLSFQDRTEVRYWSFLHPKVKEWFSTYSFLPVHYTYMQIGTGQHFLNILRNLPWRCCVCRYCVCFRGWVKMWPSLLQFCKETAYSFLWETHRPFHASYNLVWIVAFIMNLLVQGFNRAKQLFFRLFFDTHHHQYRSNGLFGRFNKIQYLNSCQAQNQEKVHVEVFRFYKPYSDRRRYLCLYKPTTQKDENSWFEVIVLPNEAKKHATVLADILTSKNNAQR